MADDAVDAAAPAAAPPRGLIPLLTVLVFVVMMDGRVVTAVLPEIADDLDASVAGVATSLTAYLLAYGTFQLAYGPLADRVGAMRVVSAASFAFVAVVAAGAFVPGLGALVGARFLAGAVAAAFFPLALATVGNLVPYHERQAAVATLVAAVAAGQVMGSALGGFFAEGMSWRAMFVLDSFLAAGLVLPLWRVRDATPPTRRRGERPFAAHAALLRNRHALALYAAVLVEGAGFFGGLSYLSALLHDRYGLSFVEVGLILTLDGVAILVTSRLVGRARRRFGENALVCAGGLVMAAGYLGAVAVGNWQVVVPAVVALGAGFALCHTTLQTRATELSTTARGTAISLFAFALFLGSGTGTALLGVVLDRQGFDGVLLASGAALALVGLLAPRLTAPSHAAAAVSG